MRPWKISKEDVRLIRAAVKERNRLRRELGQLTNRALAEKLEIPEGTINGIACGQARRRG